MGNQNYLGENHKKTGVHQSAGVVILLQNRAITRKRDVLKLAALSAAGFMLSISGQIVEGNAGAPPKSVSGIAGASIRRPPRACYNPTPCRSAGRPPRCPTRPASTS